MKFRLFLNTREKALLALSAFLFTIGTLTGTATIILSFKMFFVILDKQGELLKNYWIAIIMLLVSGIVLEAAGDLVKHNLGFNVIKKIRKEVIIRLKQFSLGFYTNERIGEISNIVHKDVDNMEMIVAHIWSRMFGSIAVSMIIGTGLFVYNRQMGLALFSLIPFALFVLIKGTRANSLWHKTNQDNLDNMLNLFIEYTKGISVIKSFKYAAFKNKINNSVDTFSKSSMKVSNSVGSVMFGYLLNLEMCYAVLITTGAYLVFGSSLTGMNYIIIIILGKEFYAPFFSADAYWVQYIAAQESLNRISKITEAPILSDNGVSGASVNKNVEFKNVDFHYEENSFSLKDINFKVEEGRLTALVGSSGSGKTTITNLMLRFYDFYKGSILIGDKEIRSIPYDDLLSAISIVQQDVILFSGTIYDNILMGNTDATESMVTQAAQKAMIHDDIILFPDAYQTELGELGYGLSGGQKQRLSIARAFLKDAPVVILDEATSGVDPINERKIQLAISNLVHKRTIIVIAHHLKTIQNADQIIVFDNGSIVEKGSHTALVKNKGLYQKMWNQLHH